MEKLAVPRFSPTVPSYNSCTSWLSSSPVLLCHLPIHGKLAVPRFSPSVPSYNPWKSWMSPGSVLLFYLTIHVKVGFLLVQSCCSILQSMDKLAVPQSSPTVLSSNPWTSCLSPSPVLPFYLPIHGKVGCPPVQSYCSLLQPMEKFAVPRFSLTVSSYNPCKSRLCPSPVLLFHFTIHGQVGCPPVQSYCSILQSMYKLAIPNISPTVPSYNPWKRWLSPGPVLLFHLTIHGKVCCSPVQSHCSILQSM
ncbi:DNA-directed RNA polymerase II subunit RPB1-like [Mizuhopecten yessoensis]|uniref:DNA-directed RNA polymerase II subunit RPB1-like n=1 Tax=Mizuhopecten yessoensis TaxID=6573 RepID=UPI000B4579A8|nr:DNA-directed RNA polymerase II subunit RPB1-like [Mizuhopecten yessoensis]